jgi:hypothetical protein
MRRKRPKKWRTNYWVLHPDNAQPYTAYIVRGVLAKIKMAVVPNKPCSPDLAPSDFFVFRNIKIKLKGFRFVTVEEVEAETQMVLNPHKERLSGCISKAETLGSVRALPKGLL